jgi:hypothetical protein
MTGTLTTDREIRALTVTVTSRVAELPAATLDTCDRCGVGTTAIFLVTLANGGQLTLCRHHTVKFGLVSQDAPTYLNQTGAQRGENHGDGS